MGIDEGRRGKIDPEPGSGPAAPHPKLHAGDSSSPARRHGTFPYSRLLKDEIR